MRTARTALAPTPTSTVPGSGGGVGAGISCAAQGFSKTMSYTGTGRAAETISFNTYNDPQGPIGPNGIVVVAFTPTGRRAPPGNVFDRGIPGHSMNPLGTTRTSTISTSRAI